MTAEQALAACFEIFGLQGVFSCRRCGALVPMDRRGLHLDYHHPHGSWRLGVPPDWAAEYSQPKAA